METVVNAVYENVHRQEHRQKIYEPLHKMLRAEDWDTVDEVVGLDPAYDELLRRLEPHLFDEDEDDDEA